MACVGSCIRMQDESRFCISSQQGKGEKKFGTVVSIDPEVKGYEGENQEGNACYVRTIPEGALCTGLCK